MNYEEIYAKWDDFPDCRILIPGERVWGKELPGGRFGINSMPLDDAYRLDDIVTTTKSENGIPLLPQELAEELIVHRRWQHNIRYTWDDPAEEENGEDEAESLIIREKILKALQPLGMPAFFAPGCAYLLATGDKTEQEVADALVKSLGEIGVEASLPTRLTREG